MREHLCLNKYDKLQFLFHKHYDNDWIQYHQRPPMRAPIVVITTYDTSNFTSAPCLRVLDFDARAQNIMYDRCKSISMRSITYDQKRVINLTCCVVIIRPYTMITNTIINEHRSPVGCCVYKKKKKNK
jgi:hypothetical protein